LANLEEIKSLTREFSAANDILIQLKKAVNTEMENVRSKYFSKIKESAEKLFLRKADLVDAINSSRNLFNKPKTIVLSGVRLGFHKEKDRILWDDDEQVVKLIEKKFDSELARILIRTEKKPVKESISKLDESELKKISCRVYKGQDKVLIKTLDSEVDKFMNSLMKESDLN
jgi:hypothetical protein